MTSLDAGTAPAALEKRHAETHRMVAELHAALTGGKDTP
jgi:hypothetical protein